MIIEKGEMTYRLASPSEQDGFDRQLFKTTDSEQKYIDFSLARIKIMGRALRVSSVKERAGRFLVMLQNGAFMPLEEIDEITASSQRVSYPK
jgi:hypothetical protein